MLKPVCYLDLDDTLIRRPPELPQGAAAPGADSFLRFLLRHFEVRWLTMWCPGGTMSEESLQRLHRFFGLPVEELRRIRNPRAFDLAPDSPLKHQGIDFAEARAGRPFVWIEDHLNGHGRSALEAHGFLPAHIHCNVTEDAHRLSHVRALLIERFRLREEVGAAVAAWTPSPTAVLLS